MDKFYMTIPVILFIIYLYTFLKFEIFYDVIQYKNKIYVDNTLGIRV